MNRPRQDTQGAGWTPSDTAVQHTSEGGDALYTPGQVAGLIGHRWNTWGQLGWHTVQILPILKKKVSNGDMEANLSYLVDSYLIFINKQQQYKSKVRSDETKSIKQRNGCSAQSAASCSKQKPIWPVLKWNLPVGVHVYFCWALWTRDAEGKFTFIFLVLVVMSHISVPRRPPSLQHGGY